MSDFDENCRNLERKILKFSRREEEIRNEASLGPNNSWKAVKFHKKKPKHLILMKWWTLMYKN